MNNRNLKNQKFNRLTAIRPTKERTKKGAVVWEFICECGELVSLPGWRVSNNHYKSCGCLGKENIRKNILKVISNNKTHGMSHTRPYSIWHSMIQRCSNSNNDKYHRYGGRGIVVCKKWHTFKGFWEDMHIGYKENLTLDRVNNDGNYNKSNCRWATTKQQRRNSSRHVRELTFKGRTMLVKDWSDLLGINANTLRVRLHRGWSVEKALSVGVQHV